MKPVSNLLHRTPWWALLLGGLALLVGLGLFATPFHLIELDKRGATPEERRAIKSEINSAFSESALDIAHGVVKNMRDRTRDPDRREELDSALEELNNARQGLREAGAEVARAKREAADNVSTAVQEARRALADAKRQADLALKDAGPERERVAKSIEESMKAADAAEKEAKSAVESRGKLGHAIVRVPHVNIDIDLDDKPSVPAVPFTPPPGVSLTVPPAPPPPALPPEVRRDIRQQVSTDLYRAGVGGALILIFIPLFALAIVSKFFIDRARGAQRMAEAKRREAEYHRMSQQVTEAKLSALQAQVEPHFLYNTLASVQALTEADPPRATEMTGHLISYLRNALPKMRESSSTVGQEIELVRAYLNILQMRMGKRLAFEIDVPPELVDAPFPPLMLPSLVENAIKHGLEPQREGGTVRIFASAEDNRLRLAVADTGRGFSETLGSGVGLENIRERLAALYGDNGKLTLEANQAQGVLATIEVPRDGRRTASATAAGFGAEPSAPPPSPQGAAARTLAAMGSAERVWRKGLSFAFVVLVVIAAVFAGLGAVGVAMGLLPVQFGDETMSGPTGALIGTAGIAAGFSVVVLALAIVLAVVYGLGFLFVGLAIFIPIVIIVSMMPVLAPFILLGLAIWWFVRYQKRQSGAPPPPPPPGPPAAAP
ncbi:MAG TPA: histidine kinase [Usitatibacter sp.]|nr:histidine kinase [Usitatibacter sp.]